MSKSKQEKELQKRSQRIVRSQQYVYVTYLEENPDFVRNETAEHWKELSKRLNRVNGPRKSPEDWKMTFMRWKHQVAYRARQASSGQNKLYKTLTQIDVRALIALGKDVPENCQIIGETDAKDMIKIAMKRKSVLASEMSSKKNRINIKPEPKIVTEKKDDEEEEEEDIELYTIEGMDEEEDEEEEKVDEKEDEEEEEPPQEVHIIEEIVEPPVKHELPPKRIYAAAKKKIPAQAPSTSIPVSSRATSPDSPHFVAQPKPVRPTTLDDREFQLQKRQTLAMERRAMAQERIADAFERMVSVMESRLAMDADPDHLF
ncbi:hypothetical protein DMENIID0001_042500 [Sergentomyia squamirostris]